MGRLLFLWEAIYLVRYIDSLRGYFMPTASLSRRVLLTLGLLSAAVLGSGLPTGPALAADKPVTVFAAASLKDVLTTIAKDWKASSGKETTLSFAASSALAKQVESGAPADVFISADLKWMDHLDKAGLIKTDSRVNLLGNRLVLVGSEKADTIEIGEGADLAKALGDGRLAVGLTASVPAGIYAKQALEKLKLWDSLKDRLAESENVRAALTLVARGEAPLGIVYETDAKADKTVKQIGIFLEDSHDPIVYPAAVTRTAEGSDAVDFLAYLQSDPATKVFTKAGFTVLKTK